MYVYDEDIQLNIKNVQVLTITKNIKYQSDYRYSVVFLLSLNLPNISQAHSSHSKCFDKFVSLAHRVKNASY